MFARKRSDELMQARVYFMCEWCGNVSYQKRIKGQEGHVCVCARWGIDLKGHTGCSIKNAMNKTLVQSLQHMICKDSLIL